MPRGRRDGNPDANGLRRSLSSGLRGPQGVIPGRPGPIVPLDAIVTRNPKDFAGSPVPVLTPAELLALVPKAPDA